MTYKEVIDTAYKMLHHARCAGIGTEDLVWRMHTELWYSMATTNEPAYIHYPVDTLLGIPIRHDDHLKPNQLMLDHNIAEAEIA